MKDLEIDDEIGSARLIELIELHKRYLEEICQNMLENCKCFS